MSVLYSVNVNPTKALDDLKEFKEKRYPAEKGKLLTFKGVEGYDVYNTSMPFFHNGKIVIAGRVEKRDSEYSITMFFEEKDGAYELIPEADKIFGLQDPFLTFIGGKPILGGVDAIWRNDGSLVTYHTDFYDISDLSHPRHVLHGPARMKDIRLLELPDKRVAVFSRPNGDPVAKYNKKAAVGFVIVNDLCEVTEELIANAPLIEWLFVNDEWGGCNQLHNLTNGLIGIIGHKSWRESVDGKELLHYYSFAAAINPTTREISPTKVIGSRDCFPPLDVKYPRVADVCFTSGIIRNIDGTADLYSGLSDSREGILKIDDPFKEYEDA